ncbi:MAG: hypothetical protein HYR71_00960 [Chloroflexi bacterium]|nr:hypothetical protein [Chloroflexota bacterium]
MADTAIGLNLAPHGFAHRPLAPLAPQIGPFAHYREDPDAPLRPYERAGI